MGKVDRFCYAVLGSRHCTCKYLTLPVGPASLHRRTQSMSLYGHAAGRGWSIGSILNKDAVPFSNLGIVADHCPKKQLPQVGIELAAFGLLEKRLDLSPEGCAVASKSGSHRGTAY